MRNWSIIIFCILLFCACKKTNNTTNSGPGCNNSSFEAKVGGLTFAAGELIINTNYGGAPASVFTEIYACSQPATHMMPPLSYFNIDIANSTPGTYYLGKLWAKRDSINVYNGSVSYTVQTTPSISYGYMTDSIHNGILTISSKDEVSKQISGTFSFTLVKYNTTDTVLITVTDGKFKGCY